MCHTTAHHSDLFRATHRRLTTELHAQDIERAVLAQNRLRQAQNIPRKSLIEFFPNRVFVHFVQGQERLTAHGVEDLHGRVKLLRGERRYIQDGERL